MAQMFRYPNLLRSSRRRFVFVSDGIVIGSVAMRDGVVGDYQRVTLDADAKDWAYVYVCGINAAGNVPEGTELVLSCFVRVDGGPKEARPTLTLVCGDGTEEILKGKAFAHESVGGVDALRHAGGEERRRIRQAGVLRQTPALQGWHHHRRRAACDFRRHQVLRMGAGCWGGVAVGE